MLRKVYLYGVLGRRYGWRHELDIESLPEAVWALDANHPGFILSMSLLLISAKRLLTSSRLLLMLGLEPAPSE